jgi:hypothetical protein
MIQEMERTIEKKEHIKLGGQLRSSSKVGATHYNRYFCNTTRVSFQHQNHYFLTP